MFEVTKAMHIFEVRQIRYVVQEENYNLDTNLEK